MLRRFDRLWVFGDSHSTPNLCVSPAESFWGLTATMLDCDQIVNISRPALSFDSLCHVLIAGQQQYDWQRDFFIIGIPPLERITIFDDHKDTPLHSYKYHTKTWTSSTDCVPCHRGLINLQYKELDKAIVLINDRSWLETQILRQIFLITQWLDCQLANYVIVNLSKNLDVNNRWGPSEYILDYCLNHARCRLFQDSLYDVNLDINKPEDFKLYGWYGHHGSIGNQLFFEKAIKPILC